MINAGHNFAHVMTAQLSWHVQNSDLIVSSELWLQKKNSQDLELWAHELFVKASAKPIESSRTLRAQQETKYDMNSCSCHL